MKKVLKALEMKEVVKIFYHGKLKGVLTPNQEPSTMKVTEHPYFNMQSDIRESVDEVMEELRVGR